MSTPDYSFLFRHVDLRNIGQHDMYNAFLRGNGLAEEFALWQEDTPGAIPIGVCPEAGRRVCRMDYIAMVFEDEKGRRYYVHVPGGWVAEARVADQGPQAMKEARHNWEVENFRDEKAEVADLKRRLAQLDHYSDFSIPDTCTP